MDRIGVASLFVATLLFTTLGCEPTPQYANSAAPLVAESDELLQEAESVGLEEALVSRLGADAIRLVPRGRIEILSDPQHLITEIASSGDFGYSVNYWPIGDSMLFQVAVWRLKTDLSWTIEAFSQTRHPGPVLYWRPNSYASRGWVRASRLLYQEASRVSMLKVDRDLARLATESEDYTELNEVLSDSVLQLQEGGLPKRGRHAAILTILGESGMTTWVPAGGEVAATGDLGYTFGFQTTRPYSPDTTLRTSAYLRIWQSQPDSSWKVLVSIHGDELEYVSLPTAQE